MKVKCIKLYNEITKQDQSSSPWLTMNKEYVVLEIRINPGRDVLYRLVGDNKNGSPALYDARQFDIISNKISSNWLIHQTQEGIIYLSPQNWLKPGFWENFYDQDFKTLEIYKYEAKIIYKEEKVL